MKKILEYSVFKNTHIISRIENIDIIDVLELCADVFGSNNNKDEIKQYLLSSVNWDISIKATVGSKIVGCYLLNEKSISSCSQVNRDVKDYYMYKTGIQGISLAVDQKYRGLGIGRDLRNYVNYLGYDYIWGYQDKSLNNIENWTNYGREIVGNTDTDYITLMDFDSVLESVQFYNDGIFISSLRY